MIQTTSPAAVMQNKSFKFRPFSRRQKMILTWWMPGSPYEHYDGIIADGSIRSGKTVSMSLSFVMWAMQNYNGYNFGLCGKSIGSLRRNVINALKQMLGGLGYQVQDKRADNYLIIRCSGVVNYFYMFGGKDESSQDLVQGITLAGVLLDEVALMPESFVDQATGRCSVEGAKLWFNCNPENRLHWFKLQWINRHVEKQLLYLHFTMDDNLSLSERTKERYRNLYVGVFFRRYILGEWVSAEGLIYDMWSEANLYDPDQAGVNFKRCVRYIACDYGTTNPMVFLDSYYDGNTFYIENEYYYDSRKAKKQKTDYQYADDLEKFIDHDHSVIIIIDPSAVSFRMELRNRGYIVKEADNSVLDGIRLMATMIKQLRFRVNRENCMMVQREIESYAWNDKSAQKGIEEPEKVFDHAMDAARYLIKTLVNRRRLAG